MSGTGCRRTGARPCRGRIDSESDSQGGGGRGPHPRRRLGNLKRPNNRISKTAAQQPAGPGTAGRPGPLPGPVQLVPWAFAAGPVLSCAEAFECADTVRAMGEYKRRLARDFNALQDRDPMSDGIKMSVHDERCSASR